MEAAEAAEVAGTVVAGAGAVVTVGIDELCFLPKASADSKLQIPKRMLQTNTPIRMPQPDNHFRRSFLLYVPYAPNYLRFQTRTAAPNF